MARFCCGWVLRTCRITQHSAIPIHSKRILRNNIQLQTSNGQLVKLKSLIVVRCLFACDLAGVLREKCGFLGELHSSDVYSGYSASIISLSEPVLGYSAPAAKLVSVNKVVNSHRVVDVPQVVNVRKAVSVPQVVPVNRLVAAPSYSSYGSGLGLASAWDHGYSTIVLSIYRCILILTIASKRVEMNP
ncbi:cuticular protein CPG4 [Danaus plexippus plexippus]|uniref:Cuticular protein CPG4 n=1 Tax=Danaus plexippus plexippus TaxID=278856 RepID=A0A212FJI7_DANPL|nr:cuticular protein CPG4 [Danaus plexippus plexippus]